MRTVQGLEVALVLDGQTEQALLRRSVRIWQLNDGQPEAPNGKSFDGIALHCCEWMEALKTEKEPSDVLPQEILTGFRAIWLTFTHGLVQRLPFN